MQRFEEVVVPQVGQAIAPAADVSKPIAHGNVTETESGSRFTTAATVAESGSRTAASGVSPPLHIQTAERFGFDPNSARHFLAAKSAADARNIWDYRASKLTLVEARKKLDEVLGSHKFWPRASGSGNDEENRGCISDRIMAYLVRRELRRKNQSQSEAVELAVTAYDPDDMLRGWGHGYSCRIGCQDGLTLVLVREESVSWRSQKANWPDKTIAYKATLFSHRWDELKTCQYSRRGHWLQRLSHQWSLHLNLVSKTQAQKSLKVGRFVPELPGQTIVHQDAEWLVVKLHSAKAAQRVSEGTMWCTKHEYHAAGYVQRGLFIVYRSGLRYCLCCPATGEVRNVKNEDVQLPAGLCLRSGKEV